MTGMDLQGELANWPVGTAAVVVVGPEGVRARAAHGDGDGVLPWASITKIVTALTVLDAWADGTVDLDAPCGPAGSTVRHLLAHTSGLPFDGPDPVTTPGRTRIYSNTGYEVLADHLAQQAGGPFADELTGRVLAPLGMTQAQLTGSPAIGMHGPDDALARLAAKEGSPAAGLRSPVDDLARLAAELLRPQVLGPEIVGLASTVAFPGLTGILPGFGRQATNDWGLGCEIRDSKSPHWTSAENSPRTFGHFGQSGSFLWVDPDAQLACVSLCDTPFGPWAAQVWPQLSTRVLAGFA
jgi:CubicO group peptidase (beta-lactamase class C family)